MCVYVCTCAWVEGNWLHDTIYVPVNKYMHVIHILIHWYINCIMQSILLLTSSLRFLECCVCTSLYFVHSTVSVQIHSVGRLSYPPLCESKAQPRVIAEPITNGTYSHSMFRS